MTGLPQLRLLHFSDFHFGRNHICRPEDPTGATVGVPTLHKLVLQDLQSVDWQSSVWAIKTPEVPATPLLLAATGDFAHTADSPEFDLAHEFLSAFVGQSR